MNESPPPLEALSAPPKRPFWTPPRVAAIPCLLAGGFWICGGLLPTKETRICYPSEITRTSAAQSSETKQASPPSAQETKNLMESYGPVLAKYGFSRCELKNGGVDGAVDLKRLFNALGWTVIALGCIPNALSNFAIGKNTRQPSIWAAGLTWVVNFPILLLTQSVASLAFSNIALGLLVAGAANQVQNGQLKPDAKRVELHMERMTSLKTLVRSFLSVKEMIETGKEALAMAKFVGGDIRRIGNSFMDVATQSADYLSGKRKDAPGFIAGFSTIEPDPEQKRIIAGLFGIAAVIALPAMFLSHACLLLFLSAGDFTKIALETMGIAGFLDAITVFQQSCKFKVDTNSKMERVHKKGICVAVAAKGLTDLVSFMAVSDLFLGIKFVILGGSLAEFWNKVDQDGQFEGWMEDHYQKICQTRDENPEAAQVAIEEIKKRATTSAAWRKLQDYLEEKARANPHQA